MTAWRVLVLGTPALLLLILTGAFPARADDPSESRVGRIALAEGKLAVRLPPNAGPPGSPRAGEWDDAGVNDPVVAGMSVRTEPQSRAVLRVGGEAIVLSGGTELELVRLDGGGTRIALRGGRIGIRLAPLDPARRFDVETPRGAARLLATGDYDIISGDEKSPARLAVNEGRVRFSGDKLDLAVASGGTVLLTGDGAVTALPGGAGENGFGTWWRDLRADPADRPAPRHVPVEMTGHEALDRYGAWETVAGYGAVWFPNELPDDWAPFRYGHWRWIGPWGWTWIDDMPWGFAPSHYGRWVNLAEDGSDAGRWGWVPGEPVKDPAFLPAAVAFLGTAGVGLSYPDAFGPAVAWFPLAPGEVYWPSFTYNNADAIRRLNAGAVADVAEIGAALRGDPPAEIVTGAYRNRRFASVVPRSVFVAGKPVAAALIELPVRRLENAPLLAGSPQIAPPAARPAVLLSTAAAARRAGAKLAKAGETLARIVKSHEKGSELKAGAAKARNLKARAAKKRDKARNARTNRATARGRAANSRATGAPKSRAASLKGGAAEGG